jgi:hypothetical protein
MVAKKNEPIEGEIVGEKYVQYILSNRRRSGIFWGLVFIIFGGLLVAQDYLGLNLWQYFWPGILVAFGLWLVIRSL